MNPALVLFQYVKVVSLDLYIERWVGGDGRALGVEIIWLKCSKDGSASVETGGWEGIWRGGWRNWEPGADSRDLPQTNFCKEIHLEGISSGSGFKNRLNHFFQECLFKSLISTNNGLFLDLESKSTHASLVSLNQVSTVLLTLLHDALVPGPLGLWACTAGLKFLAIRSNRSIF